MKDLINKILSGLDTHSTGFSARKMSGFVIIICVIASHIKWLTLGNLADLGTVLTIDYAFITACLGLTTYESIKKNEPKP